MPASDEPTPIQKRWADDHPVEVISGPTFPVEHPNVVLEEPVEDENASAKR